MCDVVHSTEIPRLPAGSVTIRGGWGLWHSPSPPPPPSFLLGKFSYYYAKSEKNKNKLFSQSYKKRRSYLPYKRLEVYVIKLAFSM